MSLSRSPRRSRRELACCRPPSSPSDGRTDPACGPQISQATARAVLPRSAPDLPQISSPSHLRDRHLLAPHLVFLPELLHGMSTPGAARSRNGSRTLDAAATAPGRTLGVGAATAAPSFGRDSFGYGVRLSAPPCSRAPLSVAAMTIVPTFFIDGSVGGDFTSSIGPHASSQPWFDVAGGDSSSPGS
uniref:Uncharacterized protein n=1 Tax=Oryza brachyantha TaxID=4533 RepID=J3KUG0_ORYBR